MLAPASSTRSRTRCPRSWTSPRPRRCSSSSARARAPTSPPSARSKEKMAGGGTASGPVCFMKGYDAFAGVVKSGGKTRRAAKMVILDAGHPDVLEFIDSKAQRGEEGLGADRGRATTPASPARPTARSSSRTPTTGPRDRRRSCRPSSTTRSGRPTPSSTASRWTPTRPATSSGAWPRRPGSAATRASSTTRRSTTGTPGRTRTGSTRRNPCSEYMFLNDTACNLASLNLMKFVGADGEFDVEAYRYAAKVTLTAQEILVDNASYPTPRIEENSHKFRPLGLGYANLGALLMSRGLAYDSDEGRNFAAALTAIMHGEAYKQSAIIARDHGGPFVGVRREPRAVPAGHREAPRRGLPRSRPPASRRTSLRNATAVFDEALELGEQYGYRNAQVTVLAPTGTIAFMMDCDTTGVEPDIALIKYKKLVGEGFLKIVNQTVPAALRKLGYGAEQVDEILAYINEHETIEGAPHLKPRAPAGLRLRVQAGQRRAVHPLHGPRPDDGRDPAVPQRRDQQDREHARGRHGRGDREGLPRGLEARPQGDRDLPRQLEAQPAAVDRQEERRRGRRDASTPRSSRSCKKQLAKAQAEAALPHRRRLPAERTAVTHKFDIAGHEGYITVGLYPDGQPGEIFLKMAKEGSTVVGPDGLLRDDRLGGAPVRRAAQGPRQQVRPRPVRADGSPATRRSRSPSRSSTTSSAGSARGSCRPTTRRTSASSIAPRSWRMSRRPPRAPPLTPRVAVPAGLSADATAGPPTLALTAARRSIRLRPPTPTPRRAQRSPRQTSLRPKPRRLREPLAVIATNGSLGNGHAANGQWQGGERERRGRRRSR